MIVKHRLQSVFTLSFQLDITCFRPPVLIRGEWKNAEWCSSWQQHRKHTWHCRINVYILKETYISRLLSEGLPLTLKPSQLCSLKPLERPGQQQSSWTASVASSWHLRHYFPLQRSTSLVLLTTSRFVSYSNSQPFLNSVRCLASWVKVVN